MHDDDKRKFRRNFWYFESSVMSVSFCLSMSDSCIAVEECWSTLSTPSRSLVFFRVNQPQVWAEHLDCHFGLKALHPPTNVVPGPPRHKLRPVDSEMYLTFSDLELDLLECAADSSRKWRITKTLFMVPKAALLFLCTDVRLRGNSERVFYFCEEQSGASALRKSELLNSEACPPLAAGPSLLLLGVTL
ncbi:hypothetical protein FQA47_007670 [Oryzias melastigma]|uniref:Uncharacterized protein n=1 Tax=Oryzias melastigma TaxID=30732 RepID=A0A834F5A6_ORYME|nr:hypothetical protein FQA47_007670 [Oryzias melastigma]